MQFAILIRRHHCHPVLCRTLRAAILFVRRGTRYMAFKARAKEMNMIYRSCATLRSPPPYAAFAFDIDEDGAAVCPEWSMGLVCTAFLLMRLILVLPLLGFFPLASKVKSTPMLCRKKGNSSQHPHLSRSLATMIAVVIIVSLKSTTQTQSCQH